MRRAGMWLVVAVLAGVLAYGVVALFKMRVGRGDVFPEYSTLRADPLGTRALYEAAGMLPGRESVRWLKPVERLRAGAGDVVFVVGVDRNEWSSLGRDDWAALDRAAIAGAHVIVAWRADHARDGDAKRAREVRESPWQAEPEKKDSKKAVPEKQTETDKKSEKSEEKKADSDKDKTDEDEDEPKTAEEARKRREAERLERLMVAPAASAHELRWGFRLLRRDLLTVAGSADAKRGEDAEAAWPTTLPRWKSDLFFLPRDGDGWRVLYRRAMETVMISRARGAGRVTLLSDSFLLSNEAVQRERATPVLAGLLGDARRVVFVESHLGVEVDTGIAVLARRYGLAGAALTALLLAGLWIWRSAAPFAPVIEDDEEVRLVLAPTAGLEALLRRSIAPGKLFAACVEAWRGQASESDKRRMEWAKLTEKTEQEPVASYNAARKALSHKKLT